MPQPKSLQLQLSEEDKHRLIRTIEDSYTDNSHDLQARTNAMARWYKLWRNGMDAGGAFPEQERTAFSIPLVLWTIKAKLAKELDVLLGEESEIVVNPIGPSDVARSEKVKRWMNWRVKVSLKLFKKMYVHLLQKSIFGTSIIFMPWVTKTRTVKQFVTVEVPQQVTDPETGFIVTVPVPQLQEVEKEVIDFDGPDPQVENIEDWVFPSSTTDILKSGFIRRLWLSIDDILDLRDAGKLNDAYVAEKLDDLRRMANDQSSLRTTGASNDVVTEKSMQTGIPDVPQGKQDMLVVHNWFGRFRLGVKPDGTGGDERAQDVVAFFQPDKKCLLGVCRLVDIFPDGRPPFIISQAVMDVNSAYGIGMAELLEPISKEMDATHQIAISSGEGGNGPVILFQPGVGFDPEKHRLEPYSAIPCADPNGVKVVQLGVQNLGPYLVFMQELQSFAERLTALTDPQLGRQSSQPNAPRTFGQQQLLQNESNVNLLLDIRLERENLREMLQMIWDMDKRWLSKPVFFRVTESQADDVMTEEDMQGEYDFDIGPVTAISNRAQKMQETMQALALSQNMGIPQVTVALFKKILLKLGQADVAAMLPDMEKMKPPMSAKDENVLMIQGESPEPHPMDNHAAHYAEHKDFLERWMEPDPLHPELPSSEQTNPQVTGRVEAHMAKHEQAMKMGAVSMIAGMLGMAPQTSGNVAPNMGNQQTGNPFADAKGAMSAMNNSGGMNLG